MSVFQSSAAECPSRSMLAMKKLSRRSFVKAGSVALGGVAIVPRHVLGGPGFRAPSDTIMLGCVGVGSQGLRVMMDLLQEDAVRIAAVCDVNEGSGDYVEWGDGELRGKVRRLLGDDSWGSATGAWAGREPARDIVDRYYDSKGEERTCSTYEDFRVLLEQGNVDAIVIGTPDHMHAPVALAAMREGKHVFCQKPMAHTVTEARAMAAVAREMNVATQVATGNSASEDTRLLTEWVAEGAIGPVRAVHNWSSRPFWPQGIEAPTEAEPIPDHLNWDLWLGPAKARPYHSAYQPFVWRGWVDFGTSSIGDMGSYSFDTLFRVLNLDAPSRIEVSSTPVPEESYPLSSSMHFEFPARDDRPAVTVHWYDAELKPQAPEEMEGAELPEEGMLLVGDRGKILCGFNGSEPRLIPESAMNAFEPPPKTLPRSIGHYEEWFEACMGGPPPGARFEFAGPVTEAILLGNVAIRSGKTIHWDTAKGEITSPAESNELLHTHYREGWTL